MNISEQLADKGIAFINGLFNEAELTTILSDIESSHFKKAGIGKLKISADEIRGDFISWLDLNQSCSLAQEIISKKIEELKNQLNQELLLSIRNFEGHYAIYEKGKSYSRHLDTFKEDKSRVVSFILYLNKDWKKEDGGELKIYPDWDSSTPIQSIEPTWGKVVLFVSKNTIHELSPTNKKRVSFTGWFKQAKALAA
jgi:SM-20-related protein